MGLERTGIREKGRTKDGEIRIGMKLLTRQKGKWKSGIGECMAMGNLAFGFFTSSANDLLSSFRHDGKS